MLPDPDTSADLFELTGEMTTAAGLPAYEVSNHARPGDESRHNLTYWTMGTYAGIGPGAHGRRGGVATVRAKKPEAWLAAVSEAGHGIAEATPLAPADRAVEALLMGLRLTAGIDAAVFARNTGVALGDATRRPGGRRPIGARPAGPRRARPAADAGRRPRRWSTPYCARS